MYILKAEKKHENIGILPVSVLHPSIAHGVHTDNYNRIKDSIKQDGLKWPLVCWVTDAYHWHEWAEKNTKDLIGPTKEMLAKKIAQRVYVVMCGNNRLQAAKELGVDHIEVIFLKELEEVSKCCSQQRKDWRNSTLPNQGKDLED